MAVPVMEVQRVFDEHEKDVLCVDVSLLPRLVVTGSADGTIRSWTPLLVRSSIDDIK